MGVYPSADGLYVFCSVNRTNYITPKGYYQYRASTKIQRWYRHLKNIKQHKHTDWNNIERFIWGTLIFDNSEPESKPGFGTSPDWPKM